MDLIVHLRRPHPRQLAFIDSPAKRKVVRAGRRGGKTVGVAIYAVEQFLRGRRVLYATPTQDQIDRFWEECKRALRAPIDRGVFYKNETRHIIELAGTEQRIRAKTAWDADTLRGDYADILILDEFQLMQEDVWGVVGAPMLLDNDGDAVFIYTPPSMRTIQHSRATDPYHAAKMHARAEADTTGRWAAFHFSSHANPHISTAALAEITGDMSSLAYRQEIEALDIEDVPGALFRRVWIESKRVTKAPDLSRIVVAIDPSATSGGDEAGVITGGVGMCDCKGTPELHGFILDDASVQGSPRMWAAAGVTSYHKFNADCLVAEDNNGGEMVEVTISTIPNAPAVKRIHASRGKVTRAEPVSTLYEQGKVHHVGTFTKLEDELCSWLTGMASPNRLDALVWALTELMLGQVSGAEWVRRYTAATTKEAA
jgi:terminase large subunit-like protein